MAITKLRLYNDAGLLLTEEPLASLTESNKLRRALDAVYDAVLQQCLEEGFWNFAMRVASIDASAGIDPAIGFQNAFEKPEDWVRTYRASDNERLDPPLVNFNDEGGIWYADCDPLFVKFVSNSVNYGLDLTLWPESYANFVAYRLAHRVHKRVTGSEPSDKFDREHKRARGMALSRDAADETVLLPPRGSWVNSRMSGMISRRYDRRS